MQLLLKHPQLIRFTLQWHHDKRDGVSNHRRLDGLLNRLLRRRSMNISKLRVNDLCEGNSSATGEFPAQRSSDAENDSIWWRHHESTCDCPQWCRPTMLLVDKEYSFKGIYFRWLHSAQNEHFLNIFPATFCTKFCPFEYICYDAWSVKQLPKYVNVCKKCYTKCIEEVKNVCFWVDPNSRDPAARCWQRGSSSFHRKNDR